MPLILVTNERNADNKFKWEDITGEQYHYPNGYRNLIQPGEKFIYYRGTRRAQGPRRPAEYFGVGKIGEVWKNPKIQDETAKKNWDWYCSIVDYVPFEKNVPAKDVRGNLLELIKSNIWRNGVRRLDEATYRRILSVSGVNLNDSNSESASIPMPPIDEVVIPTSFATLLSPKQRAGQERIAGLASSSRRSDKADFIGKRAEAIAVKWANQTFLDAKIRWVSRNGETPGWDVEALHDDGTLTAIEVKGTSGAEFLNFELTTNELDASKKIGDRYLILLVADCLGSSPKLQIINNPSSLLDAGTLQAQPILYRVSN